MACPGAKLQQQYPPTVKPKTTRSVLGAPSQHTQTSRKGKRAWRKNIDIGDVEDGLEGLREEERVTGTILQKTKDSDLFEIDVTGDDRINIDKILSQRSAVPAVFSRTNSTTSSKRKSTLSHEDKARLLRIAKKPRKGPFNSILDPSEHASGASAVELSEAVKNSGGYDPWAVAPDEEEVKDGLETYINILFRPLCSTSPRIIQLPAIVEPHQGTSYNPPAHEIEEERSRKVEKLAEFKAKIESARQDVQADNIAMASGMQVDESPDVVEDEPITGEIPIKKMPERKTRQQRSKAARQIAEKRALAERAAHKRMLATISSVKMLRRSADQELSRRDQAIAARKLALQERLKKGLAGQRLGRHKVPEGLVDVQLGEDLSESFRALKPEGNLFRDRFLNLQQRALVEPRVPVLPKKRRNRIIEYEKHAWKRFE
ncbi:P60-like protein [Infundibulicybe gibba]|nr:P60-like protein [Infundibulicybe gibba]